MNILHVVNVRNSFNGITTVVKSLSSAQSQLGNEMKIINFFQGGEEIDNFNKINSSTDFYNVIEEFKPNIVIFHGVVFKGFYAISKYLLSQRIPFLIQLHGAYSRENYAKNKIKKMLYKNLILKSIANRSQGWIFLNEAEKRNFVLPIQPNKNIIIPNGCEENTEFIPLLSNKKIKIVFLGRLSIHHKGLDILMDGLNNYFSSYPNSNVEVLLYGPFIEEEEKALISNMNSFFPDKIKFMGAVYGEEKVKVLKNADIMILTSRYEGFPMGILEAWSFGCPCIVTKGTNIAEIVGKENCGWIVPELNSTSISTTINQAISEYLNNPSLYRTNAFNTAKKFSWKEIAKESISQYQNLMRNF